MRILLVGLWNTVPFLLLLSATVLGLKTTLRGSTKAWPASNAPLKVCDQQLKRESSQGKTTTNPIPYYTPNQTLLSYWIDAFWAICLLLLFGGGIFTYHCSEVPTSDGCIPLIKILWNCDSHYIPSKSMYNFSEISGRLCLFVRLAVLSLRPQITFRPGISTSIGRRPKVTSTGKPCIWRFVSCRDSFKPAQWFVGHDKNSSTWCSSWKQQFFPGFPCVAFKHCSVVLLVSCNFSSRMHHQILSINGSIIIDDPK